MFSCSQFLACQDPVQGQSSETQPLWAIRISSQLTEGSFPKFLYKNTVICHAVRQGSSIILAFDKNSGKELWKWDDKIDGHEIRIEDIHLYQNILVWRYAGRVYGINLDNGKTIWKEQVVHQRGWGGGFALSGVGDRFLFHTGDKEYFSGYTKSGNLRQYPTLITPTRTIHSATQMFLNASPNMLENAILNDTIAILPFGIPITGQVAIGFTVFNLTQNKEVYTATLPGDTSGVFFLPPIIHDKKIFFASGIYILAFDFMNGKLLWKERFPSFMSGSGIIYHNGMIIGNCEDTFMYALDATTGKQLWATKTSGTSSRLFEMNGVIYFTGGGDGLLHAIDAKTGTHIWKKESPDLQKNSGAWFFDSVTGADGKIYVSSYLSLFCYKAAR
jgi:outer membrane protein assembly factor BamB